MKLKIGILGAESTGKSTLSVQLAEYFRGIYVAEYAREYVENLQRDYTFQDVENIARKQVLQLSANYNTDYVFFDTELIITKVWFEDKFGEAPQWFMRSVVNLRPNFCLLCMPDLPFVQDPVRENGSRREELTEKYIDELRLLNIPFVKVSGSGEERLKTAVSGVERFAAGLF